LQRRSKHEFIAMAVRVRRILVTRSPHQASGLADRLRALGADPILIPTIEIADPTTFAPLDAALAHLDTFHWLLFTSANAVEAFHRLLQSLHSPPTSSLLLPISYFLLPASCLTAAIGPATARALEAIGHTPTLIPPQAVAESLAAALLPHALQPGGSPTRFLLIRAEEAREHLPETLRAAGAEVTIAPAYRTLTPAGSLEALRNLFRANAPDAITFTSSSTARNLFTLLDSASITLPAGVALASIGPITSATLRDLGHPPDVEAAEATPASLAEIVVKYLSTAKRT
jgi:uroporphyrinogen-III synthase